MVKLSLPHPIPITNPTSPFRNFNFMRPIKIVGSDTDLHDYQVRIHLDRSNFPLEKCKPDGSDIRFRDDSGEILPYWIERWNAAEGVIWCKIPFIPAESSKFIWMIYGNPNAKSESNGNAVFELFNVQGIKAFWHFDEPQWTGATGEVKDETGVNHGTAYGGATTTSDAKYGRAGLFDGNGARVEVLDNESLDITDEISIEMWVYPEYTGDYQTFIHKGSSSNILGYEQFSYNIRRSNNNYIGFSLNIVGSGWVSAGGTQIFDNQWSYIVCTYDGSVMKVYKSDELVGSKEVSGSIVSTDYNLKIGDTGNAGDPLKGGMDEVRIYNRSLSLTEIKILYNNYMQKMGSYFNVRKYVSPAPVVIV